MSPDSAPDFDVLLKDGTFARRLARAIVQDPHRAEDVAQAAWVVALERERPVADPRAWFSGVVRHLARGEHRARARRSEVESAAAGERGARSVDFAERVALQEALARAVARLPGPERDAIVLRYFEGCTTRELAGRLGLGEAAARKRVSRGLAGLRQDLEAEFGDREGGWVAGLAPLLAARSEPAGLLTLLAYSKGLGWTVAVLALAVVGWWRLAPRGTPDDPVDVSLLDLSDETFEPQAAEVAPGPGSRSGLGHVEDRRVSAAEGAGPVGWQGAGAWTLRVVDERTGEALERADLYLRSAGGTRRVEPEAGGRFALLEDSDFDELVALAPGHVAAHRTWDQLGTIGEAVELGLAPAAELSGQVILDRSRFRDRPVLRLTTDPSFEGMAWAGAWVEDLGGRLPFARETPLFADSSGRFRIDGLPEGWRGSLHAVEWTLIERSEPEHLPVFAHRVELERPYSDLTLHLVQPALLEGRVVWAEDGSPVTEGRVEVRVLFGDGTMAFRDPVPLDGDGRYVKALVPYLDPFARPPVESLEIVVSPRGGEVLQVAMPGIERTGSFELEDLRVHRVDDLLVRVETRAGDPIEGAVVAGRLPRDTGSARRFVETDRDGLAVLSGLARDRSGVMVGAFGYRAVEFDLEGDRGTPERPRRVVLEPAPSLEFEFAGRRCPSKLEVLLVGFAEGGRLPAGATEQISTPEQVDRLHWLVQGGWSPEPDVFQLERYADGIWRLGDLESGSEFEARLTTATGRVLDSFSVRVPPKGVARFRFAPEVAVRSWTGIVEQPGGEPIGGVSVELETGDPWMLELGRSGADGTFSVAEAIDPNQRVSLRLKKRGYVTRLVEVASTSPDVDLGTLQLERARQLAVRVVDASGQELRPSELWARLPDGGTVRGSVFAHRPRIEGLSPGPVVVEARVGGRLYSTEVSAGAFEAVLQVPAHGILRLEVGDAVPDYGADAPPDVRIESSGPGGTPVWLRSHQPAERPLLPGTYEVFFADRVETLRIEAGRTTAITP